ncbi:MAG: hypothetical protein QM528_03005 [Phycisphaerales bacterium]|nr:hypothetical protein [Phycisphaerales bacterium]
MKQKSLKLGLVLTRNDLRSEALQRIKGGYKCDACVGFATNHTFCKNKNNPGVVKCCGESPDTYTIDGQSYYGCYSNSTGCDPQGSIPSAVCVCGYVWNPHLCV